MSGGSDRLRRALVVLEFALALTLLTGGSLAIQSFFNLARVNLGLRTDHLLTFYLPVAEGRLVETDRINSFYQELLERVQAVPGVASASVSSGLPLVRMENGELFSIPGKPTDPKHRPRMNFNQVSPEYFNTLGIRVTRGRSLDAHDRAGSVPVAMVNEAFVRQYLPDSDPLTARLVLEEWPGIPPTRALIEHQIVGVYADVRSAGPQNDTPPTMDVAFWQFPCAQPYVAVRTAGDPANAQAAIAEIVRSLDSDLPLGNVKTMDQLVSERMVADRFNMALFFDLRRGRPSAGGRGHLRRNDLRGRPADARNRPPHGPWRTTRRRARPGDEGGHDDIGRGCTPRIGRRLFCEPGDAELASRHWRRECKLLPQRRPHTTRLVLRRLSSAGAAGRIRGSDGRAAAGVGSADTETPSMSTGRPSDRTADDGDWPVLVR